MFKDLKKEALDYHEFPTPGKIATHVTKPCTTQQELSLAYTPGVAAPVRAIAADADAAYRYTGKGNLVAVISDGTAVLGLGNVGALAGKPVMEGKGVLFKRFADVDVFDIEVDAQTTDDFVDTVARIASGFGGINLEDIAAPRCFEIEKALIERLDIPVFHDDQHGTAIIICAGLLNALEIRNQPLADARIVCLGAGAAGIASMQLLLQLGATRSNIFMIDRKGVIRTGRTDLNAYKQAFAVETERVTLADAMQGADIFIGVSGPDLVSEAMLASMAERPIVFALSNPDPEINPALAHKVRDDIIMATGRSDYPNQINNVLAFPGIFRGALNVRSTQITEGMKQAAARAIAESITPRELSAEYIVPSVFNRQVVQRVAAAVQQAALRAGVARKRK